MLRITPGTLVIALLAVLLAVVAAVAVRNRTVAESKAAAVKTEPTQRVPLAARDIEAGRPITAADVGLRDFTGEQLKEKKAPIDYMRSDVQIIGRVLKQPLTKGDFFLPENFYADRMEPTIAERVKVGYRAVTIAVDNVGSLDGHAVPGAMVDVVFRNDKSSGGLPIGTMTIVADVEVLAIDNNEVVGAKTPDKAANAAKETTVTLAIPVEKASRLKIVEGRGTLSLLLRNKEDRDVLASYKAETLETLMGIVPPKGPFVSQMFRRGRATTLVFSGGMVVEQGAAGRLPTSVAPVDATTPAPGLPSPVPQPQEQDSFQDQQ